MNEYAEILKLYVTENLPACGSDAQSVLEMFYS